MRWVPCRRVSSIAPDHGVVIACPCAPPHWSGGVVIESLSVRSRRWQKVLLTDAAIFVHGRLPVLHERYHQLSAGRRQNMPVHRCLFASVSPRCRFLSTGRPGADISAN